MDNRPTVRQAIKKAWDQSQFCLVWSPQDWLFGISYEDYDDPQVYLSVGFGPLKFEVQYFRISRMGQLLMFPGKK